MPSQSKFPALLAASVLLTAGCGPDDELQSVPAAPLSQGGLDGRICNRGTGQWVANATVSVEGERSLTTTTDADGYFFFDALPSGEYVLDIESETYTGKRSARVTGDGVSTIGPGECRPETGIVEGRICNESQQRWADAATVSVTTAPEQPQTQTDAFGRYTLEDVPVGSHELVVEADGWSTQFNFELRAAENVFVGDETCGPIGAIKGRICGGEGYWLANASVRVELADGRVIQSSTDADGYFTLAGVPAGTHDVEVRKGSFATSFTVTVEGSETVEVPEPECIVPEKNVAVVTGVFDSVEEILGDLGFEQRAAFDVSYDSENVINPDGTVDFIDGSKRDWMAGLLADPEWMQQYDIIFFNCGLNDDAIMNGSGNLDAYVYNLRQFVEDGGSVYASDWASEIVRLAFPGKIDFYGDDEEFGDARAGASDNALAATVVDEGLATALGRTDVTLNLNLPSWAVMDAIINQSNTLRVMVKGDAPTQEATVMDAPLLVTLDYGNGRVLYTSFHNEAQTTQDMDEILNYIIFEL